MREREEASYLQVVCFRNCDTYRTETNTFTRIHYFCAQIEPITRSKKFDSKSVN